MDDRDRQIFQLRFVEEQPRLQGADPWGCSQMHVFRLLGRVLANLRAGLLVADCAGGGHQEPPAPPSAPSPTSVPPPPKRPPRRCRGRGRPCRWPPRPALLRLWRGIGEALDAQPQRIALWCA
ncbi:hypothetical protein [Streptomyces sp. NPDC016845]|uniref:hypothetical protein n=1 Tax=Streptomyces sp. NPDC016845 TaxID=3364972 RepID=UPI0037A03FA0